MHDGDEGVLRSGDGWCNRPEVLVADAANLPHLQARRQGTETDAHAEPAVAEDACDVGRQVEIPIESHVVARG